MRHAPITWTNEDSYREQLARILDLSTTFPADELTGAPGYCPHVWITQGAADIVQRSSSPCPERFLYRNRLRTLHLLLYQLWSKDNLEAFVGAYNPSDIFVEQISIELILDCGEPATCIFVFVLTGKKLLIGQLGDFHLGEFYWADRAIIRSLIMFESEQA